MPGTRKLGRAAAHRIAMLRAMVTFLLEKGNDIKRLPDFISFFCKKLLF